MIKPTNSILHIGNFLSNHGYNRQFVEELADQMEASGWQIHRASSSVFRPARMIEMLAAIWLVREQTTVGHITVFSGLAFCWAEAAAWMFRRVEKPFVLSLHGGNLPNFAQRWPGRVRNLLGSAVVVTAPSRFLVDHMRPYRSDLRLMPNPISISGSRFRLRSSPRPTLIWLRAFHSIYNPLLAVQVLSILRHQFSDARLIMVGPDKGDGSLQETWKLADALDLTDRIEFVGQVPKSDVPLWLHRADIFINTSNTDNTPISVLEAMSNGLCVVSTNVGGIPYLLNNGEDALLTPPNDPKEMAVAVTRLINEPDLAQQLSIQARNKVARFDWAEILPQWHALFMSVAAGSH